MKKELHVLIVEDIPSDAELAERELRTVINNYRVLVVDTENEFRQALETFKPDLIISDYEMPTFDGLSALRIKQVKSPLIPFIILTGSMNEDTAVECMKEGADDYVIKEHIQRLGLAILNALENKKNERKRKQAENLQKTLYNISNALNKTLKMQDLYDKIREFLGDVIDTTNFYIALYDEETDMISLPFDFDEKDDYETFPAGNTLTKYVIKTGKPLLADTKFITKLKQEGEIEEIGTPCKLWLGVPLIVEQKVIGVAAVQSYDDSNLYTEEDIDILTFVSETIALAINKKHADEQIKKDLEIKNILLREVHHRVKNNMQIISSMLKLQSHYVEDEKALELFKNSQNRVKSMALIHERIYKSKDLASVNFKDYIENLTSNLFASCNINSNNIELKMNIRNVVVNMNNAVPLGLIINELISNALKHAFYPNQIGKLSISFRKKSDGKLELIVEDNGVGFKKDFDFKNPGSLGFQLINALTTQLQGSYEISGNKGMKIILTF